MRGKRYYRRGTTPYGLVKPSERQRRTGYPDRLYYERHTRQKGYCFLCGGVSNDRRLAADHDHSTGKPRALLCDTCNLGLGCFKDDPTLLNRAAGYLKAYQTSHPEPYELLMNLRKLGAF